MFGKDADEYFHAWSVAKYIGEVAAAGKKEYALPMYVNCALRDPFNPGKAGGYASGGPTDNVICYLSRRRAGHRHRRARHLHQGVEEGCARHRAVSKAGGPLLVPEIGNDPLFARYFYDVLGAQALGIVPFGIDYTGYSNYPLGARNIDEAIDAFARAVPIAGADGARLGSVSASRNACGVRASRTITRARKLDLGRWTATLAFNEWQFGQKQWFATGNAEPGLGGRIRPAAPCSPSSVPTSTCSPGSACA